MTAFERAWRARLILAVAAPPSGARSYARMQIPERILASGTALRLHLHGRARTRAGRSPGMKPLTVYRRVVVEADLEDVENGKRTTAAVLHTLRDRLTRAEGRQAVAQLPRELK